mgnify:FL=1
MEPEEDVRSALNRELQEETALSVKIERLVGIYSDPTFQIVRYPDGSSVHFVTTLFDCSVHSGRLQGSDEGSAWGWFAPGALPNPLLPYTRKWIQDTLDEHTDPRVE